jgi:hypothetical protein
METLAYVYHYTPTEIRALTVRDADRLLKYAAKVAEAVKRG